MAPTFKHSKGTVVLADQYNVSQFFTSAKASASCETADITAFPDNDKKYLPGRRDATVSLDGLFAYSTSLTSGNDIDNEMEAALGGSTMRVITIGPAGETVGDRTWMFRTIDTKWDVSMAASDVVKTAAEMQASSGSYRGGRWLRGPSAAARTSTGTGAALSAPGGSTAGGGTAGGGVAHMHVIAASTITTGYTIKVQHSTSGTTWVDLVTVSSPALTTADGGTFTRTTVAGTVKEQLRETCSAFTGGAAKSLTYAVAFARTGTIR